MKKLLVCYFLMASFVFALEITNIDNIDFGVVVKGQKNIFLKDIKVNVEGSKNKEVEIVLPDVYDLGGNAVKITPKETKITLDSNGKGLFVLDFELDLKQANDYEIIKDKLMVKVKYIDEIKN